MATNNGEDLERWESLLASEGSVSGEVTMEVWRRIEKLKVNLLYDPVIPKGLCFPPWRCLHIRVCCPIYNIRQWEEPRYVTLDEEIIKCAYMWNFFELKRKQNHKNLRRMNGTEKYIGWGNSGSERQTLCAHSQTSLLASNIYIWFIYIIKLYI